MKIINKSVPVTLNKRCITAALFAVLLAPMLASRAVTHVPMFCPKIMGYADSNEITPVAATAINIPVVALLD
ncbi:hypothetical protein SDC9_82045 [bioreactor metagenome]|uniref:Uncharacterized protein n=1 Tax=bioreactor metagenome TaxID=1076179 RepID=A0A644Z9R5_9ZZZZ